jgi:hypothetical protein
VIEAGTLLYVTTGEYSNYICHGVFVAAKEIPVDVIKQYEEEWHRKCRESGYFSTPSFAAWLCRAGYVVELDAQGLHAEVD